MKEFIYTLKVDGQPFYIGRTNNLTTRLNAHKNDKGSSKKALFIQESIKNGKEITIEPLFESEDGLGDAEYEYITNYYGEGYKLVNSKEGDREKSTLSPIEQARLRKQIASYKANRKSKERAKKAAEGFVPCDECVFGCSIFCRTRAAEAKINYELYKKGVLTEEDLKRMSDERTAKKTP